MRLSKRFKLGVSQFELDFVDIDTARDLRLFVDPHYLSLRSDRWSVDAAASVQHYFGTFLERLRAGKQEDARRLFSHLGEPNDTCLGMSRGRPRGNGVGERLANDMFESLIESKAVKTGLLTDLEDARVFVRGIDKDRVSDIATVLIRRHLIDYTIDQCTLWGIPLTPNVPSGDMWDADSASWVSSLVPRLIVAGRPILLVPKAIATYSKRYTAKTFHQHFVLNYLKHEHLRLDTILVQKRKRKDGSVRRWVTKKSIVQHEAPCEKDYLAAFTDRHPAVFADFKAHAAREGQPLDEELTSANLGDVIAHLILALTQTPKGADAAGAYHRLIAGVLELCLYPALIAPRLEVPLHSGRKRIDITFDNAASSGFFARLHGVHKLPCAYIMVECKNYSSDVNNPELDQLAGRFGVNRGQVGILVSRTIEDLDVLIQRCADTFKDGRGLMLPLCDEDLRQILPLRAEGASEPYDGILTERMRRIAML